jgi:NAD(P)H-dependent FMN reductase
MKRIFFINGSASSNSSNQKLIDHFITLIKSKYEVIVFDSLKTLPHFDPELSVNNTPQIIIDFRKSIETADGIIICTPEYVFSIPSGLKNAIEWCVSTTVFSEKPAGLITASASGEMGHKELQLIMKTVMANFTPATTLLIQGVKGKINMEGEIIDAGTETELDKFANAFKNLVENSHS